MLLHYYKLFLTHDRVLTYCGLLLLVLVVPCAVLAFAEPRIITGENAWIKPIKFCLSTGIFLLTMAWLVGDLRAGGGVKFVFSWGFGISMVLEIILIIVQAWREVPSHYNITTPLDSGIFASMGLLITLNTLLLVGLLLAYIGPATRPLAEPAYVATVVLGLLLMLFSSAIGGWMISLKGHTVGAPDGGPGLPLLGWSTVAGDPRIPHFVGLHAIQLMLLAWFVLRDLAWRGTAVLALSAVCIALTVALTVQAYLGRPLIR